MATPYSDTNTDDLSNALFENLTEGVDFELPQIDFNDPQYNLGDTTNNKLYADVSRIELGELTSRQVGGPGAFDALMETFSKHLLVEYEKGRITGTEYANAYVQFSSGAMSQAIQFLLGKDQAYWSSLLVQAQAKTAEIASIQALVQLAKLKTDYYASAVGVEKVRADYALTKMQLASEDARFDLIKTQDDIEEYRLSNVLPSEMLHLSAQTSMVEAQRASVLLDQTKATYEIETLLPDQHELNLNQIALSEKQIERITADISVVDFNVEQMLPAQLLNLTGQTAQQTVITGKHQYELDVLLLDQHNLLLAQIGRAEKEVEVIDFDLVSIKPVELSHLQAQTTLVGHQSSKAEYEILTLLPDQHALNLAQIDFQEKQVEKIDADITAMNYNITSVLPAQVAHTQAQTAQVEAVTLQRGYELETLMVDDHNQNLKNLELADSQILKVTKDIEMQDFQLTNMLPAQLTQITAQVGLTNMQRDKLSADRDNVVYSTSFLLPAQMENITHDTAVKEYQATYVLPAQVGTMEADTLIKEYTRQQILPAQRDLTTEQMEAKRAESLDMRSDGLPVTGTMGKQKDLYEQQIESYKRDAEQKVARMLIDTWITQKGVDNDLIPPTQLADASLNSVITALKSRNQLT